MLFSSITFLYYFLPFTMLFYFVMPPKGKNLVLLAASFFFYFWGEPKYCLLMAVSILIGYIGGYVISGVRNKAADKEVDKRQTEAASRRITAGFVSILLLFLAVFKYADFVLETAAGISGADIPLLKLALPIGISFYSFQLISYLLDVYWGNIQTEKNLIDFAVYVVMFPQLIAGPIVRFQDIQAELKCKKSSFSEAAEGIVRFCCGLAKKVLIADVLGELVMKLDAVEEKHIVIYWVIAIVYTLQIYYDFSGYSDMAIGLGRMFGFHFPENFDYPYISKSVTEFWRRWHMTLGGWFRDYVYIPLGGSRVSFVRWVINVFVVWFLSGLWHGASWNYVLWGLYYGVLLMFEKMFLKKWLDRLPKVFAHAYTLFFVITGFVLFRLENLSEAFSYLKGMFGVGSSPVIARTGLYQIKSYLPIILFAVIGATPFCKRVIRSVKENNRAGIVMEVLTPLFVIGILGLVTAFLIQSSVHPFLYFRF